MAGDATICGFAQKNLPSRNAGFGEVLSSREILKPAFRAITGHAKIGQRSFADARWNYFRDRAKKRFLGEKCHPRRHTGRLLPDLLGDYSVLNFNTSEHAALIVERVTSIAERCFAEVVADVKARFEHHQRGDDGAVSGSSAEPATEARTYNYDTTPGTVAQSFGAFHKASRDMLVDDLKRSRAAPDDLSARWRLQMSSAIYAVAGARFAALVVHRSAVGERDVLERPALDEKRYKQSRGLRAVDLDPVVANAVSDAASGDPVRVANAGRVLRERIASGTEAEVQIAAVLLGQIGDPVEQRKINRLAEQIERERWQSSAGAAAMPAPAGTVAPANGPVPAPAATDTRSQIVTAGGETARRITPPPATPTRAPPDVDDFDALYGEAG